MPGFGELIEGQAVQNGMPRTDTNQGRFVRSNASSGDSASHTSTKPVVIEVRETEQGFVCKNSRKQYRSLREVAIPSGMVQQGTWECLEPSVSLSSLGFGKPAPRTWRLTLVDKSMAQSKPRSKGLPVPQIVDPDLPNRSTQLAAKNPTSGCRSSESKGCSSREERPSSTDDFILLQEQVQSALRRCSEVNGMSPQTIRTVMRPVKQSIASFMRHCDREGNPKAKQQAARRLLHTVEQLELTASQRFRGRSDGCDRDNNLQSSSQAAANRNPTQQQMPVQLVELNVQELESDEIRVLDKARSIQSVQKDVLDIQHAFQQLSSMVAVEGEQIDNIEQLVDHTQEMQLEGARNMLGAAKTQSKRKAWYGGGIAGAVGAGVGAVLGPVGALIGGGIGAAIGTSVGKQADKISKARLERDARKAGVLPARASSSD